MEWVTANMHILLQMNSTVYSYRLQMFPTVPRFAVCQSNVFCLYTAIHRGEWQLTSHVCKIWTQKSYMEMMPGDVCLKTSPGSYMKQMLKIRSCGTVSITIANLVTVKPQIVLCSSWSNIPILTYKMQLASMWSTSCNIWHLANQQSQHKLQWPMVR